MTRAAGRFLYLSQAWRGLALHGGDALAWTCDDVRIVQR